VTPSAPCFPLRARRRHPLCAGRSGGKERDPHTHRPFNYELGTGAKRKECLLLEHFTARRMPTVRPPRWSTDILPPVQASINCLTQVPGQIPRPPWEMTEIGLQIWLEQCGRWPLMPSGCSSPDHLSATFTEKVPWTLPPPGTQIRPPCGVYFAELVQAGWQYIGNAHLVRRPVAVR